MSVSRSELTDQLIDAMGGVGFVANDWSVDPVLRVGLSRTSQIKKSRKGADS